MQNLATKSAVTPFVAETTAQSLEQIHDRLRSEADHHERRKALWDHGTEPVVAIALVEAHQMADTLLRASQLLRLAGEGQQ